MPTRLLRSHRAAVVDAAAAAEPSPQHSAAQLAAAAFVVALALAFAFGGGAAPELRSGEAIFLPTPTPTPTATLAADAAAHEESAASPFPPASPPPAGSPSPALEQPTWEPVNRVVDGIAGGETLGAWPPRRSLAQLQLSAGVDAGLIIDNFMHLYPRPSSGEREAPSWSARARRSGLLGRLDPPAPTPANARAARAAPPRVRGPWRATLGHGCSGRGIGRVL